MLSNEMNIALNKQVMMEAESSMAYLAMASWAEQQPGLDGVTSFFYQQSDEERLHMLKLIKFINERGGKAEIPSIEKPLSQFDSVKDVFGNFLQHEFKVSESINELVETSLKARDFATHSFLQWYVNEQMEEERVARQLNDKLELIGDDKSGLYLFDRDILLQAASASGESGQK